MSVHDWIYKNLGSEACGNTVAPGDWMDLQPPLQYPPVVHVSEDAWTLWIGTATEWHTHMSRGDAHRLAWFILYRWWIRAEWFGLRRRLWFWALRKRLGEIPGGLS